MKTGTILSVYDENHPLYKHYNRKNLTNYHGQKSMAKKRKVEWQFNFHTWIKWWIDTGHFHERGVRNDQYQMCRKDDRGPYSPDNVYCDLGVNNRKSTMDNLPELKQKIKEHLKRYHKIRSSDPKWIAGRQKVKKTVVVRNVVTNEIEKHKGIKSFIDRGYTRHSIFKSLDQQTEYKGYVFLKIYK